MVKGSNHFNRFVRLSEAHWREVQNHAGRGLPQTPRALALRKAAQRLFRHIMEADRGE